MTFDKRQTNIAKGIAILLMLWHHLFYDNPNNYNQYVSFLFIGNKPLVAYLANFAKVCVAIFCILSGYGIFKSFESFIRKNGIDGKLSLKNQFIYIKNHLLKLMFEYWFIYVVFAIIGLFINKPFYKIYDGNIFYGILDILGLSAYFNTPSLNATWWFMYVVIFFYIFFPIIYKIFKLCPEAILFGSMFLSFFLKIPYLKQLQIYLFSYILGMYLAQLNTFNTLKKSCNNFPKKVIVILFLVTTFAFLRDFVFFDNRIDSFFGLSIIIASFLIISHIPIFNSILAELGKYSSSIFMFHTFIYLYYFKSFIYWFKYPIIIFVVLTAICYGIARLLELFMNIIRYNTLLKKLTSKIS